MVLRHEEEGLDRLTAAQRELDAERQRVFNGGLGTLVIGEGEWLSLLNPILLNHFFGFKNSPKFRNLPSAQRPSLRPWAFAAPGVAGARSRRPRGRHQPPGARGCDTAGRPRGASCRLGPNLRRTHHPGTFAPGRSTWGIGFYRQFKNSSIIENRWFGEVSNKIVNVEIEPHEGCLGSEPIGAAVVRIPAQSLEGGGLPPAVGTWRSSSGSWSGGRPGCARRRPPAQRGEVERCRSRNQ